MRNPRPALLILPILFAACSSPAPKVEEKPEPVTGLHALAQMFSAARAWQPDVQVLREVSLNVGDLKRQPGRAAAWQATFVSPAAGQSRSFTFSVVDASTTMRAGIFPDAPNAFTARGQTAQPFLISAAKKDTDEVWGMALKHAEEYAKKNPDMPISYLLEFNNRSPNAAWRVVWGESLSHSAYSVLVDASSGEFVEVLH